MRIDSFERVAAQIQALKILSVRCDIESVIINALNIEAAQLQAAQVDALEVFARNCLVFRADLLSRIELDFVDLKCGRWSLWSTSSIRVLN